MESNKKVKARFKSEVLVDYMKKHNLSNEEFAKLCKITLISLNRLLAGSCYVGIQSVVNVSTTIGVRLDDMVEINEGQL